MTIETWFISHEGPFVMAVGLFEVGDPVLVVFCTNCEDHFFDGLNE